MTHQNNRIFRSFVHTLLNYSHCWRLLCGKKKWTICGTHYSSNFLAYIMQMSFQTIMTILCSENHVNIKTINCLCRWKLSPPERSTEILNDSVFAVHDCMTIDSVWSLAASTDSGRIFAAWFEWGKKSEMDLLNNGAYVKSKPK